MTRKTIPFAAVLLIAAAALVLAACAPDGAQQRLPATDRGASPGAGLDRQANAPRASSPTGGIVARGAVADAEGPLLDLTNVRERTAEFIRYNRVIRLTSAHEEVKRAALSELPAPCCSQYSAYTCCCECNMARTIWGLSNHLIADLDADADQVRDTVAEWIGTINPDGFTGDACFRAGGCGRPFADNGCGGMAEERVTWGG